MSGAAWSLKNGGGADAGDWFERRLRRARALFPTFDLDTVIGDDVGGTVTSEFVNRVGVATAEAGDGSGGSGGIMFISVGDNVTAPSSGLLQLTGTTAHVRDLAGAVPWYMASLVKLTQPLDVDQVGQSQIDMIGVYGDATNRVALGVLGDASGGSATNWVGHADLAGSITTVIGPPFDGEESPVWHLFEAWFVPDGGVHFAIDGVNFANTIPAADVPAVPAALGMVIRRDAIGDAALVNYDKYCVIVQSPRPGEVF